MAIPLYYDLQDWIRWGYNSRYAKTILNLVELIIAYRGIHVEVSVYIFAHLHTTLHTEENLLGVY